MTALARSRAASPTSGIVNLQFGTRPLVFHAQGHHDTKPNWPLIRDWFDRQPALRLGKRPRVSVITCNNGHGAMGLLEASCAKLGLDVIVSEAGIEPWVNARDKPPAICAALNRVATDYTLYIDSRDGILIGDPEPLVDTLLSEHSGKRIVFGADRLNWPTVPAFKAFEDGLARDAATGSGRPPTDCRYLNGGAWIGETAFARRFFAAACSTPPHPDAPKSEQGILKAMLADWQPSAGLDHYCTMIQNVGFILAPIFAFE